MTPEEMFEANMPLAIFVLRKYRRGYDEDDAQEAYLALWEAVLTWKEGGAAFSSYAVTVIRNHMARLDYLAGMQKRQADRHKVSMTEEDRRGREVEWDVPYEAEVESAAAVSEYWRRAENELHERELLIMRMKVAGYDMNEIGGVLGVTRQAVHQMLHRRPRWLAEEVFGGE